MTWTTPTAPALLRFAEDVAMALTAENGHTWTAEPSTVANCARLVAASPTPYEITIRHKAHNFDPETRVRLTISGNFPRAEDGHPPQYTKHPQAIHCSSHRSPAAIAGDIRRRFWPRYCAAYAMAEEEIRQYEQNRARQDYAARLLEEHAAARRASYSREAISGPGWRAQLSLDGSRVTGLRIHSLDLETAVDILAILAKEEAS